MNKLLDYQQIGALLASGLMLVTGCKSASVSSGSSYNPSLGSPSQIYKPSNDDIYQPQSPTPVPPPAVLPMPGYSEPEVPPAPSTQKSRWNLVPSNFKTPFSRPSRSVDQTAADSDGQDGLTGKIKKSWATKGNRNRRGETVEEVVRSRQFAAEESAPAFGASGDGADEASDSATTQATEVHTPVRSRFVGNSPVAPGARHNQPATESSLGDAIPVPELSNEAPNNAWEDAPNLLPPSP